MVKESSSDIKELQHLTNALSAFYNIIWDYENDLSQSSFAFTQFSDSIVISAIGNSLDSFEMLQQVLLGIVMLANDYHILVRGGITKGKLIHDRVMVVGPAMVDAYRLESLHAIYPRVIIEENLKEDFEKALIESLEVKDITACPDWDKIFVKDDDGWWYLDFINITNDIYLCKCNKNTTDYKDTLRDIVEDGKQNTDHKVREKYIWLENKL